MANCWQVVTSDLPSMAECHHARLKAAASKHFLTPNLLLALRALVHFITSDVWDINWDISGLVMYEEYSVLILISRAKKRLPRINLYLLSGDISICIHDLHKYAKFSQSCPCKGYSSVKGFGGGKKGLTLRLLLCSSLLIENPLLSTTCLMV